MLLMVCFFSSTSEMLCCGEQGHLHTYRFCDNVWTFILENASFKTDNEVLAVDRVKIVACDAKIIARWAASKGEDHRSHLLVGHEMSKTKEHHSCQLESFQRQLWRIRAGRSHENSLGDMTFHLRSVDT